MNALWKPGLSRPALGRMMVLSLGLLLGGCTTPKIDWAGRVGIYTYDQAVIDMGPPDRYAKLGDGTVVAEWLTRRGYSYGYAPVWYGSPHYYYGPFYPGYIDTYTYPNYYLRLVFGPDGRLKTWKNFYR